ISNKVVAFKHCLPGPLCPSQTFSFNSGMADPLGAWVDPPHYMFVANAGNGTVTRYKHNNPAVNFTYSAGLSHPQDVVTYHHHIFVTDNGCCNTGSIKEYKLNQNAIQAQCTTPFYLGPYGIAVDAHGDVFVSWSDYVSGHVSEYVGGLGGCNPTT